MQGIETFVQQSVKYPLGTRPVDDVSTLPISDYFRSQEPSFAGSIPPEFGMKSAVYNGLFATVPDAAWAVTPNCTGVACAWKSYYTLAFCNSCTNITDQVQSNARGTRHTLPSGLFLATTDSGDGQATHFYNATVEEDPSISNSLEMTFLVVALEQSTVVQDGIVNVTAGVSPVAGRCTLSLCVKEFLSASFTNGHLDETPIPSATVALGDAADQMTLPDSDLQFQADFATWQGFSSWFDTLLSGTYSTTAASGESPSASADSRNAVFQVLVGGRGDLSLQALFDNVAHSATHFMRSASISADLGAGPVANGTTSVNATIVSVDWAWLSFPFAVWILVLLYTIAMIAWSKDAPSWRDQTIATLCHGLDDTGTREVASIQRGSDMKDKAKLLYVRLVAGRVGSLLEVQDRQERMIPLK